MDITKDLGVHFDSKLHSHPHIDYFPTDRS